MSAEAHDWATHKIRKVPARQRVVLNNLADFANRHGWSWPSIPTIAEESDCSQQTVRDALKWLWRFQFISEVKPRFNRKGRQTSNAYRLNLAARLPSERPEGDELSPPSESSEGIDDLDGDPPTDQTPTLQSTRGAPSESSEGRFTEPKQEPTPEPTPGSETGPACAATSAAPEPGSAAASPEHVHNPECECHPNPHRPKLDGVRDDSPAVVLVPLVGSDGRPFALTEGLLGRLGRDYPGVDAGQAARNIRNWCLAHPRRRKTPGGVAAFVTAWFGREQDRASRGQAPSRSGAAPAAPAPDFGTCAHCKAPCRNAEEGQRKECGRCQELERQDFESIGKRGRCACGAPFWGGFARDKGKCLECLRRDRGELDAAAWQAEHDRQMARAAALEQRFGALQAFSGAGGGDVVAR